MGVTGTNPIPFAWLGGHGVLAGSYFTLYTSNFSLYLTRHRLYSATLKRFLSSDPLGLSGGLNLYTYGEGDPLSYIDPLGLCGESVLGSAWSGSVENLAQDGLMNMSAGAQGLLQSPYDLAVGLFNAQVSDLSYKFDMLVDPVGTLQSTYSEIQNLPTTVRTAVMEWMDNPVSIGSTIGQFGIGIGAAKLFSSSSVAPKNASSLYDDVTKAASRYANRATDVTKSQFQKNLIDSGFTQTVSKDGKVIILQKNGAKYILRDAAKSTGGATVDFYKAGSKSIDLKIRLGE